MTDSDVKFHFIIDILEKEIVKVSTKSNTVDIGTKKMPLYTFTDCLHLLSINIFAGTRPGQKLVLNNLDHLFMLRREPND